MEPVADVVVRERPVVGTCEQVVASVVELMPLVRAVGATLVRSPRAPLVYSTHPFKITITLYHHSSLLSPYSLNSI